LSLFQGCERTARTTPVNFSWATLTFPSFSVRPSIKMGNMPRVSEGMPLPVVVGVGVSDLVSPHINWAPSQAFCELAADDVTVKIWL
jgi:hypothetical protein